MKITQIISGTAIVIAAVACAHNQKESDSSGDSRIKPSSANAKGDSASEYGNQGTRMGAPTDSSRRQQAGSAGGAMSAAVARQSDASLIGSPAWWRTHVTADGKPRQ